MSNSIPAYPVVHVTVRSDGSAHVNVAGRHVDFAAGDAERTRIDVLAYAVEVAQGLGRGVRVHSSEPEAVTYDLGVYPDGAVEILDPAAGRAKAAGMPRPQPLTSRAPQGLGVGDPPVVPPARPAAAPTAAPATSAPPLAVAAAGGEPDVDDPTVLVRRPVARLTFSTGEVVTVGSPVIVGRKPTRGDTDWPGAQLVSIEDPARKISRAHCAIAWRDGHLVVIDRASTNGTTLSRGDGTPRPLETGALVELVDGDVLRLGTSVDVAIAIAAARPRKAP